MTRINREKAWLGQFLYKNKIDLVISDNRYGFYHPQVYSVLISHQLAIRSGFGPLIDRLLQRTLYRFMTHFREIWVPDEQGSVNLAGKLSHPTKPPGTVTRYIGTLSRFETCTNAPTSSILIILSGPEPQRSLLEQRILGQVNSLQMPMVLVRGLAGLPIPVHDQPLLRILDFADSKTLNELVCEAGLIICRSGYTSLMDLLKLKKRLIVIPTPGQAEQEYLAGYLDASRRVLAIRQAEFHLSDAVARASDFEYALPELDTSQYKKTIADILKRIKN